jgi:mannose-6-phosphate isomerase-like protein (cupin superfamily)
VTIDGATGDRRAMAVPPFGAEPIRLPFMGRVTVLRRRGEETDGGFLVVEVPVPAGGGAPLLHSHPSQEFFYTLEGELHYFRQTPEGRIEEIAGGPGTTALVPGGMLHTFRNFSNEPGRFLAVLTPPHKMEQFLLAMRDIPAERQSPQELIRVAAECEIVTSDIEAQPYGARSK